MLRKITIVLATTAAFTGVLTVESFARGGAGDAQIGGGLGGHMNGGYGMGHFGGQPFGRGTEGQHFAGTRGYVDRDGHFDHHGHFGRGFIFGPGSDYDFYDNTCDYSYYPSVVCPPADLD